MDDRRVTVVKMSAHAQKRWRLLAAAVTIGVAGVVVGGPHGSLETPVSAAGSEAGTGGEYHALSPARIYDSRPTSSVNDVAPIGKKPTSPQGSTFDVAVLGKGGIPADPNTVLAAVVNVTVASPDRAGFLSIRPTGGPSGESSLVNFDPSQDVPNLAVVGIGAGGNATVTLTSPSGPGSANVIIDVFGWISKTGYVDSADSGSRFVAVGPGRILDTRTVPVPPGWGSGQMVGADQQITLPIRGADSLNPNIGDIVPNDHNVTGVMVNITAVNDGGQATFVAATPEPTPPGVEPATSVTNLQGGQVKANTAIVPVGSDGSIRLYNSRGATHLIVDVLGYLIRGVDASVDTGRIIPLSAPFRAFDTRQVAFGQQPLGYGSVEDWSFAAFTGSVKLNNVAVGAQSALIGNLTATDLSRVYPTVGVTSFLTVYPGGQSLPNSSNVNVQEGKTVPNMSLIRYGADNVVKVYNYDGSLHYILDVYAVVLA